MCQGHGESNGDVENKCVSWWNLCSSERRQMSQQDDPGEPHKLEGKQGEGTVTGRPCHRQMGRGEEAPRSALRPEGREGASNGQKHPLWMEWIRGWFWKGEEGMQRVGLECRRAGQGGVEREAPQGLQA